MILILYSSSSSTVDDYIDQIKYTLESITYIFVVNEGLFFHCVSGHLTEWAESLLTVFSEEVQTTHWYFLSDREQLPVL